MISIFGHPLQFLKKSQSSGDLELCVDNSYFNTSLYVTHSYFLTIRHALANCLAFMKSTKVLLRIGLGSCCALIVQALCSIMGHNLWLYHGSTQS